MTIVEAIKIVLENNKEGMTASHIYDEIISQGLYSFGAKSPIHVVVGQIRRRCKGLDFPTAHPVKIFEITGHQGKEPLFALLSDKVDRKKDIQTSIKSDEQLPEEKINAAFIEHLEIIRQQVFEYALNNSPSFFEHLVLDLLLKMGYGYDKNAGVVTGRSHDGGIDGVINEDKLGLDLIYIQAKRYQEKKPVGRKELQAFVGAMESVNKGVFITTSKFTKDAIRFVERQQKNIKLIDGELLSNLLVRYQVGISTVQSVSIFRVDSDYYSE